jgi:HSP20 family protein
MFGLVPFSRKNGLSVRDDFLDLNSFSITFSTIHSLWLFQASHPIKADIRETEKEYIIEADMPGVKKEDIRLELRDGVLTVGVERNEVTEERGRIISGRKEGTCLLQKLPG